MRKRWFAALLAAVWVLSFGGCTLSEEQSEKPQQGFSSALSQEPGSGPAVPEVKMLDASTGNRKFDAYTELFNDYRQVYQLMTDRLNSSLEIYHQCAGSEEGFREPENVYTCYSISKAHTEKNEGLYDRIHTRAEMDELDRAFMKLYPSIETLTGCLNDIYDYTDRKMYLTDHYEKGRDFHAVLWVAEPQYWEDFKDFETEYFKVAADRQVESVEYYRENGRDMMCAVNLVMIAAGAIQKELLQQGIEDENLVDMDLERVEPLYDAFVGYMEEVRLLAKDQAGLDEEGFPYENPSWNSFLTNMTAAEYSFTEVVQRVKNQNPIGPNEVVVPFAGAANLTSFDKGVSAMANAYRSMIG